MACAAELVEESLFHRLLILHRQLI